MFTDRQLHNTTLKMKILPTLFLCIIITTIFAQKECQDKCLDCSDKGFLCNPFAKYCEDGSFCCTSSSTWLHCCKICRVCEKDIVAYVDGLRLENFDETTVYISEQATFPQLEFVLCSLSVASWELSVEYEGASHVVAKEKTVLGKHWIPIVSDANVIGGEATLIVKTNEIVPIEKRFKIRGIQPAPKTVQLYIGNEIWFAKAIAMQESSYRQFDDKTSMPLRTDDGGYGLFQLTDPVPTTVQKWSWKANVDEAKRRLRGFIKIADDWMTDQRSQARADTGHDVPVPDEKVGNCFFSDSGPHQIEDAVAIKMYNGAYRHYVSWNNSAKRWQFNRFDEEGKMNYVERVCSRLD